MGKSVAITIMSSSVKSYLWPLLHTYISTLLFTNCPTSTLAIIQFTIMWTVVLMPYTYQFANVMGVRASELTNRRELRTFRDGDALNSTGLVSLCARTQTEGKGVSPSWWTSQKPLVRKGSFSELMNFPEAPGAGAQVYIPDIESDDGAARAYYVRPLPLNTMETWRVQLCTQQKLRYHAILGFWECAAQSRDCANS